MKAIKPMQKMRKTICMLLIISMAWISLPYGYGLAAMINPEDLMNISRGQQARDRIQSLLVRDEIQTILIEQGINIQEAEKRINTLTDAEAIQFANEIDTLPAGGDPITTIVIASLIVFFVLLVTDITGYTDVFPFVD
jgi:hypothetical protein